MRVLLTGGSGFIAAHCLELLLKQGHSVVTTVRSQEKANKIKDAYKDTPKSQLDFAIVEDIAQPDAFDEVVKSDPPFETVLHTASPFHFNVTDVQKELLDPAVIGTTGILKSIKASAPSVKRVVITSSFAAIINPHKGLWPGHTYTEEDWSPLTHEEALQNPSAGYRASKTFAERAAWDFVAKEKPNFTLTTMNPPLVFGPVVHYLNSLDALNTSNQRTRDALLGKWKESIPDTGVFAWTDVRDLALAHVKAMEEPDAAQKRFFVVEGFFSNRDIVDVIAKHFPEYKDKLPGPEIEGGRRPSPDEMFAVDNSRTIETLGIKFRGFEGSIVDLVNSLKSVGA